MKEKSAILVVDGYNIINQWRTLKDCKDQSLEEARQRLVYILSEYSVLKKLRVIVVFDGNGGHRPGQFENRKGLPEVIFSCNGKSADNVIEEIASRDGKLSDVTVATSDWAVQRHSLGYGAVRLSARELEEHIEETFRQSRRDLSRKSYSNVRFSHKLFERIPSSMEQELRQKIK